MAERAPVPGLDAYFSAVAEHLEQNRLALNQADTINGNHGDHLVQIFQVAAGSARSAGAEDLGNAMEMAGQSLDVLPDNRSASIYALGLANFAAQFRAYQVSLPDLLAYLRRQLADEQSTAVPDTDGVDTKVMKALLAGLAGWKKGENGTKGKGGMNLDLLFEVGVLYLQAKAKGASRAEAIAEMAARVSPLSSQPYRMEAGKQALLALLQIMAH
jgi:hypothetical protein